MSKLPGFKIYFESTDKVLPLHEYLWSENSRQWNNGPLNFFFFFFETCTKERFASSILSNEGNIKASILLIPLKCIAFGYESFTGKLFSNYGCWKCYSIFFSISYLLCFSQDFCQNFMKKLSFFSANFKNPFQMYITGK